MRCGMDLSVGWLTRLTDLNNGQTLDQLITFSGEFLATGHSTKISSRDFSLCKLNIIPFFLLIRNKFLSCYTILIMRMSLHVQRPGYY